MMITLDSGKIWMIQICRSFTGRFSENLSRRSASVVVGKSGFALIMPSAIVVLIFLHTKTKFRKVKI